MQILYRIYEIIKPIVETEQINKKELLMDIMVCESREHFKEIIKSVWGNEIKFRYSKSMSIDSKYCIIIGECYNPEKYLHRQVYNCDYCGAVVTAFSKPLYIDNYTIKTELCDDAESREKTFCSQRCLNNYVEQRKKEISPSDELEFWVTRDSFSEKINGYIYLITKKTTKEFYVGKTVYAPPFRWAQHLKGSRFPIKNIQDYKFEVIETVQNNENLAERELFWIKKKHNENPKLSLNIIGIVN